MQVFYKEKECASRRLNWSYLQHFEVETNNYCIRFGNDFLFFFCKFDVTTLLYSILLLKKRTDMKIINEFYSSVETFKQAYRQFLIHINLICFWGEKLHSKEFGQTIGTFRNAASYFSIIFSKWAPLIYFLLTLYLKWKYSQKALKHSQIIANCLWAPLAYEKNRTISLCYGLCFGVEWINFFNCLILNATVVFK